MYGSKPSISRLPVRSSALLEPAKRESRSMLRCRASSTSRASALSTGETPAFTRSKSSQSLRPTPQSVLRIGSCGSLARSTERGKHKKKDTRPVQDKTWQQQQLTMVQSYLRNMPGGCEILNKGTNIRPMTLNMFVDLCNLLMTNINPMFNALTLANYTEVLQANLTLLMYPGVVTTSMLKTANTMHSWPHVLAILSWLVELHALEDMSIDHMLYHYPADAPVDDKITKFTWKTVMDSFVAWNTQQTPVDVEKTFEDGLNKIYGVPAGLEDTLRQNNRDKKEYVANLQEKVNKKKLLLVESENKLKAIKNEIKKEQHSRAQQKNYRTKMQYAVADGESDIEKLKNEIEKVRANKQILKEKLAKQPITKRERDEQLLVIEELKSKRALQLQTRAEQQKISDEKDLKLSQLKRQIEQKINQHNNSLIKPSLNYPALKEFYLPQDGFLRPETKELIEDKIQKKKILKTQLMKEHADLEKEISDIKLNFENLQRELDDTEMLRAKKKRTNEELKLKLNDLKESAHNQERAARCKIELLQTELKEKASKLSQSDYHALVPELRKAHENYDYWKNKVDEEQNKFLSFFKKLDTEIDQYVPKLKGIREKVNDKIHKSYTELTTFPETTIVSDELSENVSTNSAENENKPTNT